MLHASIPPPHVQPHLAQSSLGSPIQTSGSISNANAQPPTPSSLVTGSQAGNSPPCSTLFIANLGAFVSEQELKDLFSVFPVSFPVLNFLLVHFSNLIKLTILILVPPSQGFCRLKMHKSSNGSPVAFAEYSVSQI